MKLPYFVNMPHANRLHKIKGSLYSLTCLHPKPSKSEFVTNTDSLVYQFLNADKLISTTMSPIIYSTRQIVPIHS